MQQKERDLILAAELGKALLEKNEELSKQNEKIAEDFSQKLEVSLTHLVFHCQGPTPSVLWHWQTITCNPLLGTYESQFPIQLNTAITWHKLGSKW